MRSAGSTPATGCACPARRSRTTCGELWSQFAFLMPGLLGRREKFRQAIPHADREEQRRGPPRASWSAASGRSSCAARSRRWRPNCRRNTPSCAVSIWPRNSANCTKPSGRRCMTRCANRSPSASAAQSHIVVLDALLKLRQVCCDPRLVKLPSARLSGDVQQARRPAGDGLRDDPRGPAHLVVLAVHLDAGSDQAGLTAAGIGFVELRGDTARPRGTGAAVREPARCRCS